MSEGGFHSLLRPGFAAVSPPPARIALAVCSAINRAPQSLQEAPRFGDLRRLLYCVSVPV